MTRNTLFLVCSMLTAGFAVFFTGCTAFGPMPTGNTCTGDADDGVACTLDVCDAASGVYEHEPLDSRCDDDEMCDGQDGCVPRDPACPASCDDEVACTADSCVDGACVNRRTDSLCPDGDVCRASAADGASGCYTPPTMEECDSNADCNDGVSCTTNRCESGECVYSPNDAACPTGQTCSATAGCVDDTPPTGDFRCVYTDGAHRIGYAVRVRATGMTGVRTIPSSSGETRAMASSHIRLWALGTGAAIDDSTGGWATYSLVGTPGGAINTHPFVGTWRIGDDPAYYTDILNIADLRGREGAASAAGLEAQVCPNPSGCAEADWVALPDRFYRIAPDTVGQRFWNDPVIASELRNTVVIRAVLYTSGSDDTATCTPVSVP